MVLSKTTFILIGFLCCALSLFSQTVLEFHNTYGTKHHSGTSDLSIQKATYEIQDNQLYFEFFIKDDEVILENGNLNSDHIEFWFTVNEQTDVLYSMKTDYEHTGWCYYNVNEKSTSSTNLRNEFRKDYIDFKSWQYGGIDSALYDAKVKTKKEFTGTVHWGAYTDTTIMYDFESYDHLSMDLIAPLASKATYEIRDEGYSVTISFTPEQLLFLKKSKIPFQKLNIVVFDQDKSGKSLHTLTKEYQWGNVKDFPSLKLDPPLTIKVSPTNRDFESSDVFYGSLYFFNGDRWEVIQESDNRIRFYQPYYHVSWDVLELNRTEISIENYQLYFYNKPGYLFFPQSNTWIHTGYELEQAKNITTISFKDGSIAFYNEFFYMQNPYGHGPCGACDHEQTDIYLLSEHGPKIILSADLNMGNMLCIWRGPDIELPEGWMPEFEKQSWNKELEELHIPAYNDRDESTKDKKMVISWDQDWKPVVELKDP